MTRKYIVFLFVMGFELTFGQQIDYKGFPEWSLEIQDTTEYVLYTPNNLEPDKKYPVALFLHGCCGQDYHATLRNAVDPPVRMWHNFGQNTQIIPTYIISPKTSRGWTQHFENLKKVIDDLIENAQADPQRIYICGFSMGGAGTWEFLQQYPDYFAAAIPMGSGFRGNPELVKHIPVWTIKGETDWFARDLNKQISIIRALNGDYYALDDNEATGVNPRFSEFKGEGHGIQWSAADRLDLLTWAYSKINDGNKYPVVFFLPSRRNGTYLKGQEVELEIIANDSDGEIVKIEIYRDEMLLDTLFEKPFRTTFKTLSGDMMIKAKAFDDNGKYSVATMGIKTDIKAKLYEQNLAPARLGAAYSAQLAGEGNGRLHFSLTGAQQNLPEGISLNSDGSIIGIPQTKGEFIIQVKVMDEDKDEAIQTFTLSVLDKDPQEVLITEVMNYKGESFPLSKVKINKHLWRNDAGEINFSEIGNYEGLTFIQTDRLDTSIVNPYLTFQVDVGVEIYVAYEKKDRLFQSNIPDWLKDFEKLEDQIVAQYFYYDVYKKDFPAGKISLPDAEEKINGVSTNYFVMVKKR